MANCDAFKMDPDAVDDPIYRSLERCRGEAEGGGESTRSHVAEMEVLSNPTTAAFYEGVPLICSVAMAPSAE